MTQVEETLTGKEKFIKFLWSSLHDMAFLDIQKASNGGSKMGAFILASCFIDYLAGFRYGKKTQREDYMNFVREYFGDKYDPDNLYEDLRCKLVHNYSEGGSYTFTDNHPELHKKKINDGRILLNLEDFVSDIEIALNTYFDELKQDDTRYTLALTRYELLHILTIFPLKL